METNNVKVVLVISKFTMSPRAIERLKALSKWYDDANYIAVHPGFKEYLLSVKAGMFSAVIINAGSGDFDDELKEHYEKLAAWVPVLRSKKAPDGGLVFFTHVNGRWQQCAQQSDSKLVQFLHIQKGVSVPRQPEDYIANPLAH